MLMHGKKGSERRRFPDTMPLRREAQAQIRWEVQILVMDKLGFQFPL